ncbi:MAG TPA: RtcB family protein [Candidatus Limnocylindrales bacterium]|nr:RtcB family protein [Candidatus Limnocylindrales bacterium]
MSTELETSTTAVMADTQALPRVTKPGRVPIKSWVQDLEGSALEQATNLSNLPFAIRHVALMPDAHAGYGMPIGGVLFAERAVVPYAIGVDIGCGVALVETDLTVESLSEAELKAALAQMARDVPVGMRSQPQTIDPEKALADIGIDLPASIDPGWFARAVNQLGTLGSGNHFLEVQRDETGHVFVMLHSGSRSLGKTICDAFHKRALAENKRWFSALPHEELAYLPIGTDGFDGYWAAMTFALRFAEVNRSRMLDAAEYAFGRHTGIGRFERLVDVHHNYAAWENHFGSNGIVHRKGAVRARAGETVLIPGSMGTASYVAEGLGNAEAFETSPHGAGRAMSRAAARKGKTAREVFDEMASLGVTLHSGDPKTVAEEAAYAYKDIDSVMAASATLVRATKRLTPLGVVKG